MTTVLVCTDEPNPAVNLDVPGADVFQVEGLCASPKRVIPWVPDEETDLVFMIHRRDVNLGAIQSAARQMGFDPLGIGIVDLMEVIDQEQAGLACLAKIARMSRYPGSTPEQVKLAPAERNTRRNFLSLGAPVYVGAPMIVEDTCVAEDGCRVCVSQCPAGALAWKEGVVQYDVNTCVACGICVTACPTSAVRNPVVDSPALEAEIAAAIDLTEEPTGIRYRCRDSTVSGEGGWHLVEVPCTGMLTLSWLLAPLLHGAVEVDAIDCEDGGCRLGNGQRLRAIKSDFETFLESQSPSLFPLAHQASPARGEWLSAPTGQLLAETTSGIEASLSIEFDAADVGLVAIDPAACTACEMCCQICPTDALQSVVDGSGVHISFDHRACVACGQCVGSCPEQKSGAIVMHHGFDNREWAVGRIEVRHEPTPACEICGQPVAPAAMLGRIGEMLGEGSSATMELISRRCVNCRGR